MNVFVLEKYSSVYNLHLHLICHGFDEVVSEKCENVACLSMQIVFNSTFGIFKLKGRCITVQ